MYIKDELLEAGFSVRACTFLSSVGCKKPQDICKMNRGDMIRLRERRGKRVFNEVISTMTELGFTEWAENISAEVEKTEPTVTEEI